MSKETDYRAIQIPEDVPRRDYHWSERRAEILKAIENAGHPDRINQAQLARQYDVSPAQICKDMKRLRAYLRDRLGDRRHSISETVYRKAIRGYMDSGDYDKAIKALESWNDWLREEGVRDTEPEKHSHEGEMTVSMDPGQAYIEALKAAAKPDEEI